MKEIIFISGRRAGKRLTLVWERDKGICHLCGMMVPHPLKDTGVPQEDKIWATMDHIIPASLGGTYALHNVLLAHGYCNRVRGARPITEELKEEIGTRARRVFRENKLPIEDRELDSFDKTTKSS